MTNLIQTHYDTIQNKQTCEKTNCKDKCEKKHKCNIKHKCEPKQKYVWGEKNSKCVRREHDVCVCVCVLILGSSSKACACLLILFVVLDILPCEIVFLNCVLCFACSFAVFVFCLLDAFACFHVCLVFVLLFGLFRHVLLFVCLIWIITRNRLKTRYITHFWGYFVVPALDFRIFSFFCCYLCVIDRKQMHVQNISFSVVIVWVIHTWRLVNWWRLCVVWGDWWELGVVSGLGTKSMHSCCEMFPLTLSLLVCGLLFLIAAAIKLSHLHFFVFFLCNFGWYLSLSLISFPVLVFWLYFALNWLATTI